jgi:ABC-2 type transport system ATP-binding protein
MTRPAIEVVGLTKRFGDFVAVSDLSFAVEAGEIFGLLGPNGAGKSTTIRMLCGILAPSGGEGRVAGRDIAREPEAVRERIGYMSQRFSLYLDLTVGENLDFYGGVYGLGARRLRERKAWALEMAELEGQRDRLTGDLSSGWRQRLALGCALLHGPEVVFLDEPTAGVDPISRRRFWETIYNLVGEGVTCLVTTHYMEEAERCDRTALMYGGRLIALDRPEALKRAPQAGELVQVECERPGAAVAALQGAPFVHYARLYGAGVHVAVARTEDAVGRVARTLEAAGVQVGVTEMVEPSMEDVFVSLIRGVEAEQAGGQG